MKYLYSEENIKYSVILIVAFLCHSNGENKGCNLRNTKYGNVCVCTATYCDYLENPRPRNEKDFTIITSSKAGLRFATNSGKFNANEKFIVNDHKAMLTNTTVYNSQTYGNDFSSATLLIKNGKPYVSFYTSTNSTTYANPADVPKISIKVDREQKYQTIVGFGGAITGSVSYILQLLDRRLQDNIYKSYFHKDGIGYNMMRMSIAGCDFDLEPWVYNEYPRNDTKLTNFTKLDPRDMIKLQQIQRIKNVAQIKTIKIMASAWSPPTWMKSNNDWSGFNYLKPEYYQLWADYHLRFIELMDANKMPIWAITTGNEPINGLIGWVFIKFMTLGWTPKNQAIWLGEHLGPTIKNSKYKNVLIFGNDDQRLTFPLWFDFMRRSCPNSLDYLDGLAVHWYWDKWISPRVIDVTYAQMPNKLLLNTESCIGDKPWETRGAALGSWERGERYMSSYMQDLQHSFGGWIDWNIILDEQGGPSYINNFVDSAIIVNTTNRMEFYKQPIFYAIGHYSKFIPEGSVRINTQVSTSSEMDVDVVGFKRPDGKIAIVFYNGDQIPIDVVFNDSVRGNIVIRIPAYSMHTIVYN